MHNNQCSYNEGISLLILVLLTNSDFCKNLTTLYMVCITVNREIFMYENIHVLNIHVNEFSRVPHENILI